MKTYRIATHSRRRHRQGSHPRGPARAARRWPRASAASRFEFAALRLGRRLLPRARRDDAGRRPRCAARHGRHPVRLGRRPDIPDHVTLWGLRLKICQGFDQYANVRPTRILPGIDAPLKRCAPDDLDWVIVRENSEGEYAGVGGRVHQGHPIEVATDVSMMTRAGVERIMRFAFALAQSRPRKLLTVVTKSNAQRHAMVMWDEIAARDRARVPGRDAGTRNWSTRRPRAWSTARRRSTRSSRPTCTPTSSATSPPRWPAASASRRPATSTPSAAIPSMFEPIHGSAFDIMGKGIANPIGTFWCCVMMLEHLGEPRAARELMRGDRGGDRRPGRCTRATSAARRRPRR